MPNWCSHSVIFNSYQIVKNYGIWKISSFYCCIRMLSHLRYLYRFYHSHATRTWSVCNEMYHNLFRYEYLTFQIQIHLHKQYIFDTNITQNEYAFLFPFSIHSSISRHYDVCISQKITMQKDPIFDSIVDSGREWSLCWKTQLFPILRRITSSTS